MAEGKFEWLVDWLLRGHGLWALPAVSTLIYGFWAYLRGPLGPEVYLGMLIAAMVVVVVVVALRADASIKDAAKGVEEIRALVATPNLQPHVQWLEEERRRTVTKRENLIYEWRQMVTEVHKQKQSSPETPTLALIEQHPTFPSIRPFVGVRLQRLLGDKNIRSVASTMNPLLNELMDIIDELERQWPSQENSRNG